MKKIILSLIAFLSLSSFGFSQLAVQDTSGATLANGDTVTVSGEVGYALSAHLYIFDSLLPVSTEILCVPTAIAVSGCTYSICVGATCYPAFADNKNYQSPSFTAPKGKDTNAFFADYNPYSAGTTVIRYDFKTKLGTDSTWVFVKFVATPTGIATISANNMRVSAPYPNPANNMVNFTYHTGYDAQLSIYNSLGQAVKTINLSASKESMSINTADMPSGIYICRLQSAGAEPAFRRLVVSH